MAASVAREPLAQARRLLAAPLEIIQAHQIAGQPATVGARKGHSGLGTPKDKARGRSNLPVLP